jgi:hypothetical protein
LNIVKGIYEPTEAEAKCTFDEDYVCCFDLSIFDMSLLFVE